MTWRSCTLHPLFIVTFGSTLRSLRVITASVDCCEGNAADVILVFYDL